MKIKLITASIAVALLAGCHTDHDDSSGLVKTYSVQAYDPAVINMAVSYDCNGHTGKADELTSNVQGRVGQARISDPVVVAAPQDCTFTMKPGPEGATDASNGKAITATYVTPKGLAQADTLLTGSPFTTAVAKSLGDEVYSSDAAEKVLGDLGIDVNTLGVSANELLKNTETVVAKLHETGNPQASTVSATATVLSDVLASKGDDAATDIKAISAATVALTKKVIAEEPDYPKNSSGDVVVADVTEQVDKTVEVVQDAIEKNPDAPLDEVVDSVEGDVPAITPPVVGEPVEPEIPPTGGGDGTGSGSGGTGGGD